MSPVSWPAAGQRRGSCVNVIKKENHTMEHERGFRATAVLAFLGGAALGVLGALLLAPQSGRQTRDQLRRYARKAEETLREAANEAGQKFEEAVTEGKEYVEA